MAYEDEGVHVDSGGPSPQYFDLPNVPYPPDVAIAIHQLPSNTGHVGCIPDPLLPRLELDLPDVPLQQYYCVGRYNHSATTREFFRSAVFPLAPGLNSIPHGLSATPDMFYAQHADQTGVLSDWVCYGVDDTNIYLESFEPLPINLIAYAWLLHSITGRVYTTERDISIAPGPPVAVAHELPGTPTFVLPFAFQPPGGAAPNGEVVLAGYDAEFMFLATTAGAGAPLPLKIFAQIPHSIQQ